MARNELTRSAREIADRVLDKYYQRKQVDVAEAMNCDPATVSRFVSSGDLNKGFNFLAANGFDVFDTDTQVAISKKDLELLLLGLDGLEGRLRSKYLGQ